jgi:hypothetical protein
VANSGDPAGQVSACYVLYPRTSPSFYEYANSYFTLIKNSRIKESVMVGVLVVVILVLLIVFLVKRV